MNTDQIDEILLALSSNPVRAVVALDAPGSYAVFGTAEVWRELGLGNPSDSRPLYVGKAEKNLLRRDVRQHFDTGNAGSSTLTFSNFASLLSTMSV